MFMNFLSNIDAAWLEEIALPKLQLLQPLSRKLFIKKNLNVFFGMNNNFLF